MARLSAVAERVNALQELQRLTYDEFVADRFIYTATEHDFQIAIQAALDSSNNLT